MLASMAWISSSVWGMNGIFFSVRREELGVRGKVKNGEVRETAFRLTPHP
jgi:hypothetical protein